MKRFVGTFLPLLLDVGVERNESLIANLRVWHCFQTGMLAKHPTILRIIYIVFNFF